MRIQFVRHVAAFAVAAVCAQLAAAQVFVSSPGNIPQGAPFNNSNTEQIDIADIDLDGDWDLGSADGGDCCLDQNRIWVNLGGLQGGTLGFFVDETAARAPAVNDQSRDIEFVDFDGDGDPDVYSVVSAQVTNHGCRWWTNQGGLQSGAAGFFVDQTAQRWVGLGGPGSSVAPNQVQASGGFQTWALDQDFADVDSDGDLDLIAATIGGAFVGQEPARVFLNDGLGFFSEFNPSGFQLTGSNLANGSPALWAEGVQQHNTTDVTGAFADVAVPSWDMDVGDIDGDLDLDLLLTHYGQAASPRVFRNRLVEKGTLAFRDVSGATFPQGWGNFHHKYTFEFGDYDADDDLDVMGVNWVSSYVETTLRGVGDGSFVDPAGFGASGSDDDAAELVDFDGDGDLDFHLVGFGGSEKLYENVFAGAALSFALVPGGATGQTGSGQDIDAADVDGDGDFDLLRASWTADNLLLNVLGVPDTTAPRLVHLEQPADHAPGHPTAIRVHVYDNAPDQHTRYNATLLHYSVNGGPFVSVPMSCSGGQVFRGELPASAVGLVDYYATSTDAHGNAGASAVASIDTSGPCSGLPSAYCTGKLNTDGCVPHVEFSGAPHVGGPTSFLIRGIDVLASANGLLIYSKSGAGSAPFHGGTLCVGPGLLRTPGQNSGGAGACGGTFEFDFNAYAGLGVDPGLVPGQKVWAQYWYRDVASQGGTGLTDGLTFTLCP